MTPQRKQEIETALKESIERIGSNGVIDTRAAYYSPRVVKVDATLEELHDAALSLGMTRISNWQYRSAL